MNIFLNLEYYIKSRNLRNSIPNYRYRAITRDMILVLFAAIKSAVRFLRLYLHRILESLDEDVLAFFHLETLESTLMYHLVQNNEI